ncbi:MAG: electron transfer flavoprotein subunit beta/FixA family protein [Acidimicrobiia bacterium]|nr:electron transfer flavoprotein subunit beta/FixA family protein [Acidimicrobiia bacterium]NNL27499.1 electron transfer flavoprotein subunit beta/FixA family protein [Acidimicrobiia bacterium]
MRILVCIKRVPAPGAKINLTGDAQAIDPTNLGFTISPHEECAVEEAVQQAEQHDGSVTVLTLGPAAAEEQLRSALAVGADAAFLMPTDGSAWDPMATARALTAGIGELETDGPFDLIFFGNESADSGGYQVGIRVARALGRPMVNGIKGVAVSNGVVTARRETATSNEVFELPLPAVLGIKEGINLPRYPTLKGRMAAKKKEVVSSIPEHRPGGPELIRLLTPPQQTTTTVILGTGPEAAPALVDVLEEAGIL